VKLEIRRFFLDASGNVAIIASLGISVVLLASGAAVDYGRLAAQRNELQQSLDAAALAAVVDTRDNSKKVLANNLAKAMPDAELTAYKRSSLKDGDKVSASAAVIVPASLMALFGKGEYVASATTEVFAPGKIDRVRLSLKQAFGWSNKTLRVIAVRPDGKQQTLVTADYVLTDKKGGHMRGTGTMKVSPATKVEVGDYTALRVEMEVVEYGSGKKVKYASDNPSQSNHLWVNGRQLPTGVKSGLDAVLPCGEKISHAWEDSALKKDWDVQDMFFEVDVTCGVGKSGEEVRILR